MAIDEDAHYGVRVGNDGPVRIITLDRPARRNALDLAIRPVLSGLLRTADADRAVRAIVVTGANGTICAGGDVKDMKRQRPELVRPRLAAAQEIVRAIAGGSTPVIAAVEGAAFGAGLGLALACDRVVAGSSARLSAAFTGVGFAADPGMTWSLPKRIGPARARQMLMCGDPVDAHTALAMGLVDDVVPAGEALATALRHAVRWADGPPRALALIKQAFAAPAPDLHAALDHEIEMQAELSDTDDYAEGITAFHDRRPPRFMGAEHRLVLGKGSMQIEGISAVVTGGGSGLGRATATALVAHGADVLIIDLPSSPGADTAAELGARFAPVDVTDTDAVNVALDAAEESGPIRALVHCAGRGGDRLRIIGRDRTPSPLDSFRDVLEVNLVGTYNVLRLVAARMAGNVVIDGDRGAIVLTASVAAFDGQVGQTSYTASKAAVHGITLVAARDLASWAIRVNTIAPGTFATPMLGRLRDDIREALAASVPHPRRLGEPEEFGRLAVEMLGNSYLNGQTIRLDGAIRMAPR